jgi:polyhydroxyalkanoate synthesis regulator phasin
MTDEDFLLHIGGLIKDVADNTADRVNSIMEQIADRLNQMESRTITHEDIARLEKRIYDLENR